MVAKQISVENKSKWGDLNKEDYIKLSKGLGIGLAGACLTFLTEVVTQIDFGEWTPIVVVIAGGFVNLGRKLLSGIKN